MDDTAEAHDSAWLRSHVAPAFPRCNDSLRIADLFSGCGGLSLGALETCRALRIEPRFVLASDADAVAREVYTLNFGPLHTISDPIERVMDGAVGAKLTKAERSFKEIVGDIDLALAGPPCQGHSDLNNYTRRADAKNRLVLRVARFAEVFEPKHILIENVQGIKHDRLAALASTSERLSELGYHIAQGVIDASSVGVPQTRRRFFLFASQVTAHQFEDLYERLRYGERALSWAISDLAQLDSSAAFDQPSAITPANERRIEYLFRHGLYDLPDTQRPRCHSEGGHTYRAVYGRLRWDRPAPTITTGFGCMGQGRFVHPSEKRTLTPHEAARLQFFPDFFQFGSQKRTAYQQLIGNAVPPKLAYAMLLHQLA